MNPQEPVTLTRKSYDHLVRTRDRALRQAEFAAEQVEHAHRWAEAAHAEQRRLSARLTEVCAAAAALGVSISAINKALEEVQ